MGKSAEELDKRVSAVEDQQTNNENRLTVLEINAENATKERADIKNAISTVDSKVDRLVEHLIKD